MKRRVVEPEVMDQPGLDPVEHRRALEGLRRINAVSGTAGRLWRAMRRFDASEGGALRVLDVACGGGDVTVALQRRALRAVLLILMDGCDLSEEALRRARETAARAGVACEFHRVDVVADPLPAGYDAVVSSLFLHHLSDEQAERFLRKLATGVRHVAISDLDRSGWGLLLSRVVTQVISRSPVVRVDGPRSVRAAFTAEEIGELAARAGLEGARVERVWPGRWELIWSKSPMSPVPCPESRA